MKWLKKADKETGEVITMDKLRIGDEFVFVETPKIILKVDNIVDNTIYATYMGRTELVVKKYPLAEYSNEKVIVVRENS